MFPTILSVCLEYELFIQVFAKGWLDTGIWFSIYFYEESVRKGNQCGFFSVNAISEVACKLRPEEVKSNILEMSSYHGDKEYILAPYLVSGHWILFIISPKKKKYIF